MWAGTCRRLLAWRRPSHAAFSTASSLEAVISLTEHAAAVFCSPMPLPSVPTIFMEGPFGAPALHHSDYETLVLAATGVG